MSWGEKGEGSPRRAGLDSFQGLACSRKHLSFLRTRLPSHRNRVPPNLGAPPLVRASRAPWSWPQQRGADPFPAAPRLSVRTCSRARLSPSTSRWRRSALSSASSACCCRTWILRFTASMVEFPAMVPTQLLLEIRFLPPPLGVVAAFHPTSACSALKYRNSLTRPDVTPPPPRVLPLPSRRERSPLEGQRAESEGWSLSVTLGDHSGRSFLRPVKEGGVW